MKSKTFSLTFCRSFLPYVNLDRVISLMMNKVPRPVIKLVLSLHVRMTTRWPKLHLIPSIFYTLSYHIDAVQPKEWSGAKLKKEVAIL